MGFVVSFSDRLPCSLTTTRLQRPEPTLFGESDLEEGGTQNETLVDWSSKRLNYEWLKGVSFIRGSTNEKSGTEGGGEGGNLEQTISLRGGFEMPRGRRTVQKGPRTEPTKTNVVI